MDNFNLYYNKQSKQIIMPDETTGELPPAPDGEAWYAVKWPVNPHFTGLTMIAEVLQNSL